MNPQISALLIGVHRLWDLVKSDHQPHFGTTPGDMREEMVARPNPLHAVCNSVFLISFKSKPE